MRHASTGCGKRETKSTGLHPPRHTSRWWRPANHASADRAIGRAPPDAQAACGRPARRPGPVRPRSGRPALHAWSTPLLRLLVLLVLLILLVLFPLLALLVLVLGHEVHLLDLRCFTIPRLAKKHNSGAGPLTGRVRFRILGNLAQAALARRRQALSHRPLCSSPRAASIRLAPFVAPGLASPFHSPLDHILCAALDRATADRPALGSKAAIVHAPGMLDDIPLHIANDLPSFPTSPRKPHQGHPHGSHPSLPQFGLALRQPGLSLWLTPLHRPRPLLSPGSGLHVTSPAPPPACLGRCLLTKSQIHSAPSFTLVISAASITRRRTSSALSPGSNVSFDPQHRPVAVLPQLHALFTPALALFPHPF